jgi:hypothetical protein
VARSATPLGTCLSPPPTQVNSKKTLQFSCLEHLFMLPQPAPATTSYNYLMDIRKFSFSK